jgi:hypothetical protein
MQPLGVEPWHGIKGHRTRPGLAVGRFQHNEEHHTQFSSQDAEREVPQDTLLYAAVEAVLGPLAPPSSFCPSTVLKSARLAQPRKPESCEST